MTDRLSHNNSQLHVGGYLFQIANNQLVISPESDLEVVVVCLDAESSLDFINWLSLQRRYLFEVAMRKGVETFKARVRAEHGLPEPEEITLKE